MPTKIQRVTHWTKTPSIVNGRWGYQTVDREVLLLARYQRWAMVRRPGCTPVVVRAKDLVP